MRNQSYAFIGCEANYQAAELVVFGAPFDSTTSFRPGARFGPSVMREESFGIETYSPYQDKDLQDINVFDAGDLELPFGDPAPALAQIEDFAEGIARDAKLPVLLGGEHLVTLGAVRALHRLHPELCILHLDAHADLRQDYLGQELSHACVMRRCHELLGDGRIYSFGIRSGSKEEFAFGKGEQVVLWCYDCTGFASVAELLSGRPVYVTIDLDVLDPSVFPGTGTPEAGGIGFPELLDCILHLRGLNVVGADLCELAPKLDSTGISTAMACKVLRELLLSIAGGK